MEVKIHGNKVFSKKKYWGFMTLFFFFFHPQISLTCSKAPQSKGDGEGSARLKAQIGWEPSISQPSTLPWDTGCPGVLAAVSSFFCIKVKDLDFALQEGKANTSHPLP